jgi:hypothetical protein
MEFLWGDFDDWRQFKQFKHFASPLKLSRMKGYFHSSFAVYQIFVQNIYIKSCALRDSIFSG